MSRLYRFIGLALIVQILLVGLLGISIAYADTESALTQFDPDVDVTGNATFAIYANTIAGQTFTPVMPYVASYIAVYGHITGNPVYVLVQLRTSDGTVVATAKPTKNLVYHWLSTKSEANMPSAYFTGNESGSWIICELDHSARLEAGTIYAVVVKAPAGDSVNNFSWHYDDGGAPYGGGTASTSTDGGANWSVQSTDDFMFEIWGDSGLLIHSVNVYKDFNATGDWLIVGSYLNKAETHYHSDDIEQYFRVQLIDNNTSSSVAETVLRSWDASVFSLYINANDASVLEWESGNYTVRIQATYGSNFYVDHDIASTEFVGSVLTFLDKWCISQAQWMGMQNKNDNMYYLRETTIGLLINEKGIQLFDLGIPMLGAIRGSYIYETYVDEAVLNPVGTPNPQLQNRFVWETQVGSSLADILDNFGSAFHLDGKVVGIVIFACMYVFVVGGSFPAGHGTAGSIAGFIIILMGMIAGAFDVVWVILAGVVALALVLRQLVLQGQ